MLLVTPVVFLLQVKVSAVMTITGPIALVAVFFFFFFFTNDAYFCWGLFLILILVVPQMEKSIILKRSSMWGPLSFSGFSLYHVCLLSRELDSLWRAVTATTLLPFLRSVCIHCHLTAAFFALWVLWLTSQMSEVTAWSAVHMTGK